MSLNSLSSDIRKHFHQIPEAALSMQVWLIPLLPTPSVGHPANGIHQAYQDWDFDERPNGRCQGLVAVGAKGRDRHGDS
ncbi:uncharacterized protein BKA55DRAFT_263070 [Fusarium redolens]|jgi:hypothetical protein|uniref:Uncharacterized protein n=1 Tax=Fusarium redolens TaxID=48865 RepID=A0A9P9JKK4_FUSRE|nr:uncharacterized protein BKA55DRAFT_263070 [Fusarium redolens]KAH7208493.1 hypothetical protein BKA55DRAFT_263070 [Fusarium redolens]